MDTRHMAGPGFEPAPQSKRTMLRRKPLLKSFRFDLYEFVGEEKVDMRRGTGVKTRWRLVSSHPTHNEAKAAQAALENS